MKNDDGGAPKQPVDPHSPSGVAAAGGYGAYQQQYPTAPAYTYPGYNPGGGVNRVGQAPSGFGRG